MRRPSKKAKKVTLAQETEGTLAEPRIVLFYAVTVHQVPPPCPPPLPNFLLIIALLKVLFSITLLIVLLKDYFGQDITQDIFYI